MIEACTTLNSRTYLKIVIMRNLIKFSCLLFSMALLSSCSNSEEPDYPAVASSISNSILIDILD